MAAFFDTLLNFLVFAFMGLLVWLYFKKPGSNQNDKDQNPEHEA